MSSTGSNTTLDLAKAEIRSLYLGFNRSYTNPTAELTLRLLGSITKLDLFGPGFSSPHVVDKGVEEWCNSNGPYDYVIIDSYVLEHDRILARRKPFIGDYIRFDPAEFAQHAGTYQHFFSTYVGNKLFLANWDTYGISHEMMERLIRSEAYVLDPGITLHRSKEEIEHEYGKPFHAGSDNWYHFLEEYKHRVIAFPHFVSSTEFDFSPLDRRSHIFDVVGALYPERRAAMQVLTRNQKASAFLSGWKDRVRSRCLTTMSAKQLALLKTNYLGRISETKFCYCSGGPWLYPVRKYFEIPCRGAVAIGWPCNGFADLGFIDGKNFVVARSNAEISDVVTRYSAQQLQVVADAGRSLVWRLHSEWARSEQLRMSLNRICEGAFKGSYWKSAEYRHF